MSKTLKTILIAAGVGLIAGFFLSSMVQAETVNPSPIVQLVSVTDPARAANTLEGGCTGFYVGTGNIGTGDTGYVVTAGHCNVNAASFNAVRNKAGTKFYPAWVVAESNPGTGQDDFSIMRVYDPGRELGFPVHLNCTTTPQIGDKLVVKGFPDELGYLEVPGVVVGDASPWVIWKKPVFRMAAAISYGNSGSPVFDSNNEVVGVAVGGLPENRTLSVFTPIGVVCERLKGFGF